MLDYSGSKGYKGVKCVIAGVMLITSVFLIGVIVGEQTASSEVVTVQSESVNE